MAKPTWILELGRNGWRLHAMQGKDGAVLANAAFEDNALVSQVDEIHRVLSSADYRGEPIVLALQSFWCLAATIPIHRPQDLRDRQALLYRLEELIPWNAEAIVADFTVSGDSALCVAVPIEPLLGFVHRLSATGINVQHIVPTVLLAVYEYIAMEALCDRSTVIFENCGWIDVLTATNGKVDSWATMPATEEAVSRHMEALALERGDAGAISSWGAGRTILAGLHSNHCTRQEGGSVESDTTMIQLALLAAEKLIDGQIELSIDLKKGPFGRRQRNPTLRRSSMVLQLAAASLFISVVAALVLQGRSCARQALEVTARQSAVFKSVCPNTKVPTGITTRLRSELAKLKGLRGDDASLPANVPAIVVLKELLTAVPVEKRLRLLEIRVENGRLYLDGEARAHSDAELLAQRLRGQGFEAASPKTQRLDDQRVSLRISATFKPTAAITMEGPR